MSRKVYTSDSIDVSFDPDICIHSAKCLNGLPQVFDLNARPWIAPSSAAATDVARVIEHCPSGALRYDRKGGTGEQPERPTTVEPIPDGPLALRGEIVVKDANGAVIRQDTRVTLCRCGSSANKPFCDNTHRRNGFEAP